MSRLLKFIVFFCFFIFTYECTFANIRQYQVPVLVLSGTPMQMGLQYGKSLRPQLKTVLSILENYYITQRHISYDDLLMHAKQLYDRFLQQAFCDKLQGGWLFLCEHLKNLQLQLTTMF